MDIREELDKLKDSELKELLDTKNTIIKKGSIVIIKDLLYKVLLRSKNICVLINENGGTDIKPLEEIKLLTYDAYKELKSKKYLGNNIFEGDINKIIKFLNRSLNKVYKDNYDIVILDDFTFQVTIYYPEIKIENSLGMEHTMLDVYLTLKFRTIKDFNIVFLKDYSLFRGKYTLEEYYYPDLYMFSHINSHYRGYCAESNSWCLGNTGFYRYIENCKKEILITDILFLISQFHAYLQWESIEGIPYRRLTNLKSFSTEIVKEVDFTTEFLNKAYLQVLSKINYFTYSFSFMSEDITITLNSDSVNRINILLSELYPEYCANIIEGKACKISPLTFPPNNLLSGRIIFKEKEISPELIDTGKSEEVIKDILKNNPKQILPELSDVIIKTIEINFSDYFTNKKLNSL